MILLQLIKILPAASAFKIYDDNKPVLEGTLSTFDKSVMFKSIDEDLKYQKVYSTFHVELVDKVDDIWIINVR